jgi:hypothetical protein
VSEPTTAPVPYRVIYSELVRTELRDLLQRAVARGLGEAALAAVKTIDYRLHVYPQFGEPLRDLTTQNETIWVGTVEPFVVEYVIDEERRMVFVVVPLRALPRFGL